MASFKARKERTTNPLFDADRVVREPRLDQLGTMNFQEPGQGYTEPRQYLAKTISWNACKLLLLLSREKEKRFMYKTIFWQLVTRKAWHKNGNAVARFMVALHPAQVDRAMSTGTDRFDHRKPAETTPW